MMKRSELISYAIDFTSFLLRKENILRELNQVIIFGSVIRGDYTEKSDIDLFINVNDEKIKPVIEQRKKLFEKSKTYEDWRLKGVNNEISLKIGVLDKWENLKRSIISDGYILYGKYEETPSSLKNKILIKLDFRDKNRNNKINLWRKLYGYSQKVGKKNYYSKGMVEELKGEKIGKSIIIIPTANSNTLINFLKKNKIKHEITEIWVEK